MRVVIEVLGTPAPKGSGRAMLIGGKARHIPSGSDVNSRKLRSWDTAVREAAAESVGNVTTPPFVGEPLSLRIVFRLARPMGHWGKRGLRPGAPAYPFTKPDLSKLVRSTEDTLTGIVYDDDSRIVAATVEKVYADPGKEGATIVVERRVVAIDSPVDRPRVAAKPATGVLNGNGKTSGFEGTDKANEGQGPNHGRGGRC